MRLPSLSQLIHGPLLAALLLGLACLQPARAASASNASSAQTIMDAMAKALERTGSLKGPVDWNKLIDRSLLPADLRN